MSRSNRAALAWAAALVVFFGALFVVGFMPRRSRAAQLESTRTAADQAQSVVLIAPKRAPAEVDVTLPGNVQAFQFTNVYARANGYVKRRYVDIGEPVKAGQLLAELETPELDDELQQARAALGQAKAAQAQARTNLELARTNLERSKNLFKRGIVPTQDNDDKQAAYEAQDAQVQAAAANVAASQANVDRLTNLQAFKRVVAPFDGTITYRSFDQGALVTETGGAQGRELFRIGQGEIVRVYVNVPQAYATALRVGEPANVTLQERPGRVFKGKVVRTAGALDAASRTLLTEIQVPNHDQALLAGMYVEVAIHVVRADPPLLVPASSLLVRNDGTYIQTANDGRVHSPKVQLGRDYGSSIEVTSGLSETDRIIATPSNALADGQRVAAAPVR